MIKKFLKGLFSYKLNTLIFYFNDIFSHADCSSNINIVYYLFRVSLIKIKCLGNILIYFKNYLLYNTFRKYYNGQII